MRASTFRLLAGAVLPATAALPSREQEREKILDRAPLPPLVRALLQNDQGDPPDDPDAPTKSDDEEDEDERRRKREEEEEEERREQTARLIVELGSRARSESPPTEWLRNPRPAKPVKASAERIIAAAEKTRAYIPPPPLTDPAARAIVEAGKKARGEAGGTQGTSPQGDAALAIVNAGRRARGETPLKELPR